MKYNYEKYGNPFLMGLVAMFFGEVIFIGMHYQSILSAPVIFWILVPLATMRLAHTITDDGIAQFIRGSFTRIVPDSAGGSYCVEALPGNGIRNAIGQLIECPICSGTWAAVFLVGCYSIAPNPGIALAAVLGAAGASEILHYAKEYLEWGGRNQREQAGTQWLKKNLYPRPVYTPNDLSSIPPEFTRIDFTK